MHLEAFTVGEPEQSDIYETNMLNMRIGVRFPNIENHISQPNMRRVRFFRISVPQDCSDQFLEDMKPYLGGSGGSFKQRIFIIRDILLRLWGLEPVPKKYGNSVLSDGWRIAINVLILGKSSETVEAQKSSGQ